MIIKS